MYDVKNQIVVGNNLVITKASKIADNPKLKIAKRSQMQLFKGFL